MSVIVHVFCTPVNLRETQHKGHVEIGLHNNAMSSLMVSCYTFTVNKFPKLDVQRPLCTRCGLDLGLDSSSTRTPNQQVKCAQTKLTELPFLLNLTFHFFFKVSLKNSFKDMLKKYSPWPDAYTKARKIEQ